MFNIISTTVAVNYNYELCEVHCTIGACGMKLLNCTLVFNIIKLFSTCIY